MSVSKQSWQGSLESNFIWLGKNNNIRAFASEHCGADSIMLKNQNLERKMAHENLVEDGIF